MEAEGDHSEVEGRISEASSLSAVGRPAFLLPPPEVKFDGGNMFEWSKMITLTIDGSPLGDHLTEAATPATDPEYKKWKAAESSILSWMLRSMTSEMRRDFLYYNSLKDLWDDI